jgi:hypothetical protein
VRHRRLQFRGSEHETQSEVLLRPAAAGAPAGAAAVDYSGEPVLAVHRLMGRLCARLAAAHAAEESLRVAMVGAGGCALPGHLLARLRPGGGGLLVDCVEPDAEVLEVAATYFDALFLPPAAPAAAL